METPKMEMTPAQAKSIRRTKIALWVALGICAVLGLTVYILGMPPPAHLYDALAHCISQSSTTFYGAFWCPHCADQKHQFGTAAQYLPYVECSTPDGKSEQQSCIDLGVKHYPTWVFPDGSREEGVLTVKQLAAKTGCSLPTSTPAST